MAISTEVAGLARLKTPTTLNAAASDQLREAIVTGQLAPGALLKDGEVAAWSQRHAGA